MTRKATQGNIVSVHYTGTLDSGDVFDSSRGREPIEFEVGGGQVIPGFDQAVQGLEVGESREVRIEPADAYGENRDELVVQVPATEFPDNIDPRIGQQLQVEVAPGENRVATIAAVADDAITLDLNHPLAGQALNFDIEVVGIREP